LGGETNEKHRHHHKAKMNVPYHHFHLLNKMPEPPFRLQLFFQAHGGKSKMLGENSACLHFPCFTRFAGYVITIGL